MAGVFRFVALDRIPSGFFRDEADKGYGAFCLLKTGADAQGRSWPLFISSLSIYTTPLYQYLLIPAVACFGLSEYVVRSPAALAGMLTVAFVFLLVRRWMGFWAAIVASFLLAVSPWHLPFSRWANQGILLPCFLTIFMLVREKSRERRLWVFGSCLALTGALYSYEPAKVLVPLLLAGLVLHDLFRRDSRDLKSDGILIGVLALSALPMLLFHLSHAEMSNARFSSISVFRGYEGDLLGVTVQIVRNFLEHVSPKYLFISGDANLRHSVASMGQLYLTECIALALACFAVIREKRREDVICIIWFVAAIFPASLTNEGIPHSLRTIGAVVPLTLLSARGFGVMIDYAASKGLSSKVGKGTLALLVATLCLIVLFMMDYYGSYASYSAQDWDYGWRDALARLQAERTTHPNAVISGWTSYPDVFIRFYMGLLPNPPGDLPPKGFSFLPFKSDASHYLERFPRPAVFLGRPGELQGLPVLETIRYPDGSPAWNIIEID